MSGCLAIVVVAVAAAAELREKEHSWASSTSVAADACRDDRSVGQAGGMTGTLSLVSGARAAAAASGVVICSFFFTFCGLCAGNR